jgi:hypothetical protein
VAIFALTTADGYDGEFGRDVTQDLRQRSLAETQAGQASFHEPITRVPPAL